jgi:hypothetical protein
VRTPVVRALLSVVAVAGALPLLAATGRVTDAAGQPLPEARVCHHESATRTDLLCVTPDPDGAFEIPDSDGHPLRISAPGYFSVEVPAAGHHRVVLEPSPTLRVRVVDADSGEPLAEAEVFVVYRSARQKGPFPSHRAGVRIERVLETGDVRVVGRAKGYAENSVPVKLVGGVETEAVIALRRTAQASP